MKNRNFNPIRSILFCAALAALFLALPHPAVSFAAPLLDVSVAHPILPVEQGILQEIEIGLSSPDGQDADREYELQISSESGMGMMQLPGGFATKGEVFCRAGERLSVAYRWAGAIPTERAVPETITVSIPEIGVTETAEFSIGVDLRVTGIRLPEDAESNRRREVGLIVEDILHPGADLSAMLQNLGAAPEVKLTLLREGSDTPVTREGDAFVAKFLGRGTPPPQPVVFPAEYKPGGLRKTSDGERYEWVGANGEAAVFAAPSGGRYQIKVSLKPGTGGIAVRETLSPAFDVAGAPAVDLQGFMRSTVGIINFYTPEAIPELAREVSDALRTGENAQVAPLLGAAMRGTRASSPPLILGKYLETLLEADANVEGLLPYIQNFLRGFGDYGVLILSRSGVASWKATLPDNTELSQAPKTLGETPQARARLYAGDRYVIIPFERGKDFTLHITGSNRGGTSLWKIIPEGVNQKTYPQGDWEKEIAVHTRTLLPASK